MGGHCDGLARIADWLSILHAVWPLIQAATGKDPRQELEALEAERLAEKEKANAAAAGWAIP